MGSNLSSHPPILLAEDDENDVFFMQRAFNKAGLENPLIAVKDGDEAIAYLSGTGAYVDRQRFPLPCVILTDLKMPGANGFEFLAWFNHQAHLRHIPAIVLATSDYPVDRRRAAELGAAAYCIKTAELENLISLVSDIRDTWIAAHCK